MTTSLPEEDKATALLADPGWLLLHSDVLNTDVVWVRDLEVKVPLRYTAYVRYSYSELLLLVEQRPPPDALRVIHAAKETFDGTVVEDRPLPPLEPETRAQRPRWSRKEPRPVEDPAPEPEPAPTPQLGLF